MSSGNTGGGKIDNTVLVAIITVIGSIIVAILTVYRDVIIPPRPTAEPTAIIQTATPQPETPTTAVPIFPTISLPDFNLTPEPTNVSRATVPFYADQEYDWNTIQSCTAITIDGYYIGTLTSLPVCGNVIGPVHNLDYRAYPGTYNYSFTVLYYRINPYTNTYYVYNQFTVTGLITMAEGTQIHIIHHTDDQPPEVVIE